MKKTVSVLIMMAMLLATVLAIIPVSAAPAGTAINNEDEFFAMDPTGEYYLNADLEIFDSYKATAFTGTFDGNGHTITISGADCVFNNVDLGTIKNLKVTGDITVEKNADAAGLAKYGNGTFENITSEVNITMDFGNENNIYTGKIGGIIAVVNGEHANNPKSTVITNCTNKGSIEIKAAGKDCDGKTPGTEHFIGGIVGDVDTNGLVTIDGCVNNGTLKSVQTGANMGGIVGMDMKAKLTIKNCTNNAAISVDQKYKKSNSNYTAIAGILGRTAYGWNGTNGKYDDGYLNIYNCVNGANGDLKWLGADSGDCLYLGGILGRGLTPINFVINKCENQGDIYVRGGGWTSGGGIISCFMTNGLEWEGTKVGYQRIVNCVNKGKVDADIAGGILGAQWQFGLEDSQTIIEFCSNSGTIVGTASAGGVIASMGLNGAEEKFSDLVIRNCKNTASVTADTLAAGIIAEIRNMGNKYNPTIDTCANTGTITAATVAGIIGQIGINADKAIIKNCANTGTLDSAAKADIAFSAAGAQITAGSNVNINTTITDTAAVDELVNKCNTLVKSDYTDDTIATLETALTAAKEASANYLTVSQPDLDTKASALQTAYDNLKLKTPDIAALEAKLAAAKALDKNSYTSISFIRVTQAIGPAEEALEADRQSVVDAALEALTSAMDQLKEKAGGSTKPTETEATEPEEDPEATEPEGDPEATDPEEDPEATEPEEDPEATEPEEDPEATEPEEDPEATEPEDEGDDEGNVDEGEEEEEEGEEEEEEEDTDEETEEGGCGSAITATAVVVSTVLALGAGFVFKKKED